MGYLADSISKGHMDVTAAMQLQHRAAPDTMQVAHDLCIQIHPNSEFEKA
jgi:hypothetical protein